MSPQFYIYAAISPEKNRFHRLLTMMYDSKDSQRFELRTLYDILMNTK
jgi:hypothetical protein